MNKNFPIIVLILLAVALSGCTGSQSVKTTPVVPTQTPTSIPTPTSTPTPAIVTPAPTPELTPFATATPTGKNVTIIVKDDKYSPANITIDAGDMVLWVNKMDTDYTLVEMDKKIPDMVLRARNSYIFNTTGNYRIGLYFKPMRGEPTILTINVR
jgi:plastocyanin